MKSNFTLDLLYSMRDGLIAQKTYHGFNTFDNGKFEDCLGHEFGFKIERRTEALEGESMEVVEWVLYAK